MTSRRTRRHQRRILRAVPRTAAKPIEDGVKRVRCECSRMVAVTKSGRLHAHRTPGGEPCTHRANYGEPIKLTKLPPVIIPPEKPWPRERPARKRTSVEQPRVPKAERVATGSCHECGRAVSGERQFCGPCLARRL